jgi:hypothetical protein
MMDSLSILRCRECNHDSIIPHNGMNRIFGKFVGEYFLAHDENPIEYVCNDCVANKSHIYKEANFNLEALKNSVKEFVDKQIALQGVNNEQ